MTEPTKIVTGLPRKSLSVLAVGDKFLFNGLVGREIDSDDDRLITIVSISVSGNLAFTITYCDPKLAGVASDGEPSLHSTPYSTALQLIRQQIWQPVKRPDSP